MTAEQHHQFFCMAQTDWLMMLFVTVPIFKYCVMYLLTFFHIHDQYKKEFNEFFWCWGQLLNFSSIWKTAGFKMVSHIVEKYCILVWSILTTIVSSVGNCTVLIATIKYDAIKLDNISKVMKKHCYHDQNFTSHQLLFILSSCLNLFK